MFTAILYPNSRKVSKLGPDGVTEFILRGRKEPGVWVFEEDGFYARCKRSAYSDETAELFDELQLPKMGAFPVVKTSVWFCKPINKNQWQGHIKNIEQLLPLYFAPEDLSALDPVNTRATWLRGRRILIYEDRNMRYPIEQITVLRRWIDDLSRHGMREVLPANTLEELKIPRELAEAYLFITATATPPLIKLVHYALTLAEAEFRSIRDEGSGRYRVKYEFKGETRDVLINDQLTILDAGICLDGRDRDFDLSSIAFIVHRR